KNLAAELLDEYSAQYTGIKMATGKAPTAADMTNFWKTLVGTSKNDKSAVFYSELSKARRRSTLFDRATSDVYNALSDNYLVTPAELRDTLLYDLYINHQSVTLDDPTYLAKFGSSKMANKLKPESNS